MKKILSLALCLILLLSLFTGCGDGGTTPPKKELTVDTTNIGFVNKTATFDIDVNVEENEKTIVPHALFSDGVCLQRMAVLRVHGETKDDNIALELNGTIYYGTVADGKFEIYVEPQDAGGPYTMTLFSDTAKRTVENVYIGEVFICSGQSNMAFEPRWCSPHHDEDIANANFDEIRLVNIPRTTPSLPMENFDSLTWTGANPSSVNTFSAVGYLFGREIYETLNVPVGLIHAAWGGSIAAFWMPVEYYDPLSQEIKIQLSNDETHRPFVGYNGMIAPLQDFRTRGVVWYQGESNANNTAKTYDREMETLIQSWRETMGNMNLGFTIIELPRYSSSPYRWAEIREKQQLIAANDPLVCMSVAIDLGDWADIHPRDKSVISRRAAEETLKTFFFIDQNPYPTVKSIKRISKTQVKIIFEGVGDGIEVKNFANGFETSPDEDSFEPIVSFEYDSNSITITSEKNIGYVRYGYRCMYKNVDYTNDVSTQVSVWNSYGNPLDQFFLKVS